jgi:Lrp/AsnC family transcriptional regulator, leucine-responsive regulatory protein
MNMPFDNVELDDLDMRILGSLQKDARASYRTIARELETTTPTVSARVKRMEGLGIIQGYRVDLDPQALGGSLHFLRLQVRPAGLHRVAEALAAQAGVEDVMTLSGGSLLVKVRLRPPAVNLQRIHAGIADQADVLSYEGWEAWSVKHRPPDISVTGVEVKCHQCQGPIAGEPVRLNVAGRDHVFCCSLCKKTFQERAKAMMAKPNAP